MESNRLRLVEYSKIFFLEKSWKWLNNPEIKKLTNTPDFTKEDQERFFNSINDKKDYYIQGLMYDSKPIGACGLKKITNQDAEYWGYIGEKECWGMGLGKQIISAMIQKAEEFKLASIYLYVIKDNLRAIRLYSKLGFQLEEETEQILKMKLDLAKKNKD